MAENQLRNAVAKLALLNGRGDKKALAIRGKLGI